MYISTILIAMVIPIAGQRTFAVLNFQGGPLVMGRMDPIISEDVPSGHVHLVQGGNGFDLSMTDHQASESSCTTAMVQADKSNYWVPALYFHDPENQTFTSVPFYYMKVYYFFEPTSDKIVAFPPGLRMVSGKPSLRTPPASGGRLVLDLKDGTPQPVQFTCPRTNQDTPLYPPTSNGIEGVGIQDPMNLGSGVGFPDKDCDGEYSPLRADVHFPSCYDPSKGVRDYRNSMFWPTNGDCPRGFLHFPHLFYEVYWNTQEFKDRWTPGRGKQPFVLANGDPTGYGLHGDFISGWDEAALQHIIDYCDAGLSGMHNCPGLIGGITDAREPCRVGNKVPEQVQGEMARLPGHNPLGTWGLTGGEPSPLTSTSLPISIREVLSTVDDCSQGFDRTDCPQCTCAVQTNITMRVV